MAQAKYLACGKCQRSITKPKVVEGILVNELKCPICGRSLKKEDTGLMTGMKLAGFIATLVTFKSKLS